MVLVHGFPESSHSWRHQIEPLVDARRPVAQAHLDASRRDPVRILPRDGFAVANEQAFEQAPLRRRFSFET